MPIVDPISEERVVNQRPLTVEDITVQPRATEVEDDFEMPDKFKGKTPEEIAKSYVALERKQGQVANEIGEYRQLTDRLLRIEEKRVNDLEGAGGKGKEVDFNIDPTDLLTNPRETLEKWYESRRESDPVFQEVRHRLDRVEKTVAPKSSHEDAEDLTNDPEFLGWVQSHPVRLRIAQAAVQEQDITSLDYLLTEYKEGHKPTRAKTETSQDSEVKAAKLVSTETASSGSPVSRSKTSDEVFSRRKLIQLKLTNPNEYADLSDRILRAYAEGRVVD